MNTKKHSLRADDANAFLPDLSDGSRMKASDAEFLGEEFIGSATAGESMSETIRDEVGDEEDGGPYLLLGEDGALAEEGDVTEAEETLQHAQVDRGASWMAKGV